MSTLKPYLLVLAALVGSSFEGNAQQRPLSAARVTLVAGTTPSRGGRIEVVRRAERSPQNLVIVDRNATAEDLAAALAMMNALRAAHGDSLTTDFRARPETVRAGASWQRSTYRSWLIEQLVRLRNAPSSDFSDLGVVKAVHITLPPPAGSPSASTGGSA